MVMDLRVGSDRTGAFARRIAGPLVGKRVLCVDDDDLVRRVVRRTLGVAGAICFTAATHAEAIAIAEGVPDLALVILDFDMPDGDIARLVARLRSIHPDLRLIGNSGDDRRLEFAERGVPLFLAKPWTLAALVSAIGS